VDGGLGGGRDRGAICTPQGHLTGGKGGVVKVGLLDQVGE